MFTSIYPKNYSKETKTAGVSDKARIGYFMKIRKLYSDLNLNAMSNDFEAIVRSLLEYYKSSASSYNFIVSNMTFWRFAIRYRSTVKKTWKYAHTYRTATKNIGDMSWVNEFENFLTKSSSTFNPQAKEEDTPLPMALDKVRIYWICVETWSVSSNKFKERSGEIGKRQSNYIHYY
jgi:hypothetical protein